MMITPDEALAILHRWKRQQTTLAVFFFDLADYASQWDARIRDVSPAAVVIEMAGSPADSRSYKLDGAEFQRDDSPKDLPEDLPLSDAAINQLESFWLMRDSTGSIVMFAVPVVVN